MHNQDENKLKKMVSNTVYRRHILLLYIAIPLGAQNIYQGSTLTVVRLPGAHEMGLRVSENDSVICSIPEEQNN